MAKKLNKIPFFGLITEGILLTGCGWWLLHQPYELQIKSSVPVYESNTLQKTDLQVYGVSFAGHNVLKEYGFDWNKDTDTVTIHYKNLTASAVIHPVLIKNVEAVYQDEIYEGVPLSEKQVKISACYTDGTRKSIKGTYELPERVTDDTTVLVTTDYGVCKLKLHPVKIQEIQAVYQKDAYPGDKFDEKSVSVNVLYTNGKSRVVDDYTLGKHASVITDKMKVTVNTSYGKTKMKVTSYDVKQVQAVYSGVLYEGDTIDANKIRLQTVFTNNVTKNLNQNQYDVSGITKDTEAVKGVEFMIPTDYGVCKFTPDVVGIKTVNISSDTTIYEGDVLSPDKLSFVYEDGTEKSVKSKQVDCDWSVPVVTGDNVYKVAFRDKTYDCHVTGKRLTPVAVAVKNLQSELDEAEKQYVSDNMFVTIRNYSLESGANYYLTHVIINTPAQIHSGLSHDVYGGERETPTSASKRQNWIVGVNGGNFSYATGGADTNMAKVVIKNGQLMNDSGSVANGREICLKVNGSLCSAREGASAQDLLAAGVTDTFSCGDTELILQGSQANVGIQSEQYRYPRTAVGMVTPGEYYLITAGSGAYEGGMSYDEIRDVLWSHGCVFGKCMDGGGSSSLVFQQQLINPPATGNERPVSDFLYFTDLDENTILTEDSYFSGKKNDSDAVTIADDLSSDGSNDTGIIIDNKK